MRVGLIQRLGKDDALADYTVEDIERSETELLQILSVARAADAPRIAGMQQCRYCKAKAVCPEAIDAFGLLPAVAFIPAQPVSNNRRVCCQPDSKRDLGIIKGRWQLAKIIGAAIDERMKQVLKADPDAIPGWTLKPGAVRAEIIDPSIAYRELATDLTPDQFASCCKVQIGSLVDVYANRVKTTKQTARNSLKERLRIVWHEKENEPSLVET